LLPFSSLLGLVPRLQKKLAKAAKRILNDDKSQKDLLKQKEKEAKKNNDWKMLTKSAAQILINNYPGQKGARSVIPIDTETTSGDIYREMKKAVLEDVVSQLQKTLQEKTKDQPIKLEELEVIAPVDLLWAPRRNNKYRNVVRP